MKYLFTSLILLILIGSLNAQPRDHRPYKYEQHEYRPPPSTGEKISLAGVGMLAYAIASPYNKPRVLVYSGFAFCFIGVTIDINSHDGKRKIRRGKMFASANEVGLRINF